MNRLFSSVRMRLLVTVIGLVATVVLVQSAVFGWAQSRALTQALHLKARAMGELSELSLGAALDFDDQKGARDYLGKVAEDPDVAFVVLYDSTGTRMAAAGSVTAPALESFSGMLLEEREGVTYLEREVRTRGIPGRLQLGLSTGSIVRHRNSNLLSTLLLGGLLAGLGVAVAWSLASSIGDPLRAMTEVARLVAAGRLDTRPPPVTSDDEIGELGRSFHQMITTLRSLERHVTNVAGGDLTRPTDVEGDLAAALNRMLANQRELVARIAMTSSNIRSSSSQILAGALELEQTATEQAAVVEQTTRTMESLLSSAQQVASASQNVLQHAERTHANSQLIAERITELAQHTQRITTFLDVIRDIANKTDLLALNAALEGTRAGEAGRGFSLVASQMQRLTVNVMSSVEDIKALTADIREATSASVLATEDATKRALATEQSARQINLIIQQQRSGTEQANTSMAEISEAIRQSVEASSQSAQAATQLAEMSSQLEELLQRFQLS